MHVLVTGAAGFIGSHLVERLLVEGHRVAAVDDLSAGSLANLAQARMRGEHRLSFVHAGVLDTTIGDIVATAAPDVVVHLAARLEPHGGGNDPFDDAHGNVCGTVNLLEAARSAGARKVVFASSAAVYGQSERLPVSERSRPDPLSAHAAAKASGEIYLGTYRNVYGLQTTALVIGNVYGPRQGAHAGVVSAFCHAAAAGRSATIHGDGRCVRDFVFVDDVVDAFVRAIGDAGDGRRFNVGSGAGTTVRELHSLVAATAGVPDDPHFAAARTGAAVSVVLDVSSARHGLGWEPFTELRDGVRRTLAWARAVSRPGDG